MAAKAADAGRYSLDCRSMISPGGSSSGSSRQSERINSCRSRLGGLFTGHGQQHVESRSVSERNHGLVLADDLEALALYQIGLEGAADR
jgi:hypothetical protein